MHLIYIDESGNTGNNLEDPQQPLFLLGALVVPETSWLALETDLEAALDQALPPPRADDFEVHATDLRQGSRSFRGMPIDARLALRDAWLIIAAKHNLKFIYRAIEKKRYQRWLERTFGKGVTINPHLAAFPLIAQVVNHLLKSVSKTTLGIFIFDENREVVGDVERFHKLLRKDTSSLRLDRIIEKGFFINSSHSLILQLVDLCIYQARKDHERKLGSKPNAIDDNGIALIQPLIHLGPEAFSDVNRWLQQVSK